MRPLQVLPLQVRVVLGVIVIKNSTLPRSGVSPSDAILCHIQDTPNFFREMEGYCSHAEECSKFIVSPIDKTVKMCENVLLTII